MTSYKGNEITEVQFKSFYSESMIVTKMRIKKRNSNI